MGWASALLAQRLLHPLWSFTMPQTAGLSYSIGTLDYRMQCHWNGLTKLYYATIVRTVDRSTVYRTEGHSTRNGAQQDAARAQHVILLENGYAAPPDAVPTVGCPLSEFAVYSRHTEVGDMNDLLFSGSRPECLRFIRQQCHRFDDPLYLDLWEVDRARWLSYSV